MFNIEEKFFLKELAIKNRIELIVKIREIQSDDSFTEEFLKDILDKLEKEKSENISL